MKNKGVTITIFMLLTLSIATATTYAATDPTTQTTPMEEDISMTLYAAPLYAGVNMDVTNNGNTTLTDLPWHFRAKPVVTGAGIIRTTFIRTGTITELAPGETTTIEFRPFTEPRSPFGLATTYMNASITIDDTLIRTQQRSNLLLFFLLGYKNTYIDITPEMAFNMIQNNTFDLIIDVVGLDIYSLGHLPGAVNYIWADGTLSSIAPTLDKNDTYLVYCHTDPPSTDSAQTLIENGLTNTYRMEGNYAAWVAAGYPTET